LRPRLLIKNHHNNCATARVRQKCKGANGVIAAPAPRAEQGDVGRAGIKCCKKGELGIGRIFVRWEARYDNTGRLKFVDVASDQRIKIADHLVEG